MSLPAVSNGQRGGAGNGRLSSLLTVLAENPQPREFLRYLIHTPIFDPAPKGGALGMISGEAELVELASYGLTKPHSFVERQSVWQSIPPFVDFRDSLPVRRSAAEMRQAVAKVGMTITPEGWVESVLLQPVHGHRGAPIGAAVFLFDVDVTTPMTPLVEPKDFHSCLVLAMRSSTFQLALEEELAIDNQYVPLTDREKSCLRLAARGHTNKQIANQLRVSQSTVKADFSRVFEKLEVTSRARAIEAAQYLDVL